MILITISALPPAPPQAIPTFMASPSSLPFRDILENLQSFLQFQQELGMETAEIDPADLAALRTASPTPRTPDRLTPEAVRPAPASTAEQPQQPAAPPNASPQKRLDAIAEELRQSSFCPLKENAIHTVPGQGNPSPDLVFIGEAPGQEEDEQGQAFVGRSGEILTRIITAMGLSRDDVWIGNIVKWRPPNNRAPTPEEISGCMPYLIRQLEVLNPKVIVCLGGVAAKALLDTTEGITRLRGQWKEFRGIPLMPTFHPSFLLRSQNQNQNQNKRYWEVWSDMESVLVKLEKPIPVRKKKTGETV